jgi:hypothetical protein
MGKSAGAGSEVKLHTWPAHWLSCVAWAVSKSIQKIGIGFAQKIGAPQCLPALQNEDFQARLKCREVSNVATVSRHTRLSIIRVSPGYNRSITQISSRYYVKSGHSNPQVWTFSTTSVAACAEVWTLWPRNVPYINLMSRICSAITATYLGSWNVPSQQIELHFDYLLFCSSWQPGTPNLRVRNWHPSEEL